MKKLKSKNMKGFGFFLLFVGFSLLGYSLMMEPYSDPDLFMQRYLSLEIGQSQEFYALREELLTAKYRIQDTGVSIILITSCFLFLLRQSGNGFRSPRKKSTLILIAVLLPFLTVSGLVFDLFQALYRSEFPHWADSIGIPLMGVPVQLAILLVWSLLHLLLIRNEGSMPLLVAITHGRNPWILFVSFLAMILILIAAFYGQYWYLVPGLFWLYFYLSIGASRVENSAFTGNRE